MTDKKFTELKKKVDKILDKWVPVIGLSGHRLRYKYLREFNSNKYLIAQVFPLWQYKHHTIEFFMPSIEDIDDSELEEDILHELVHILIAPASGNDAPENKAESEVREYATQCLTYAIIWAREAGVEDAKV